MKLNDFYYELPRELIAQNPLEKRDSSRLLVVDKYTGKLFHKNFKDVINYFEKGDTIVLNETKVIPARLHGTITDYDKKVEVFIVRRISDKTFEVLVKPGKKLKIGKKVFFNDRLQCVIKNILDDGNRIVEFIYDGIFEEILEEIGEVPLPPYIKNKLENKDRYQTVYAKNNGSVAAPTAGLHFTKEILSQIEDKGVNIAYVTLHVSLGTFRPVKVENIEEHKMHSEVYYVSKDVCEKVNTSKNNGKKVICVGTTSLRCIESAAEFDDVKKKYVLKETKGETNIFIYPGYKFKLVDGLVTNFHLPESTLIMLVSAFAGRENVLRAYEEAIKQKYRFFSFGDACLFIDTNI